jgi:hypothetical protein
MKRNIKLILISLLIQTPVFLIMVITNAGDDYADITRLVPVESALFDIFYFFVLSPLLMIVFIQCFSVILAYCLFKLHSIIKFKKYNYAILKINEKKLNFKGIFFRALILGFFALSIGIVMIQFIDENFIIIKNPVLLGLLLISTFFILPFLMIILSPIWLLKDIGIMCGRIKKRLKEDQRQLPDIEGVYRIYNSYIMGYSGITSIVSIILIIYNTIISRMGSTELIFLPFGIIAPFYSVAISILPILFYEWRLPKFREKLISKLLTKGIKTIDDLNEI